MAAQHLRLGDSMPDNLTVELPDMPLRGASVPGTAREIASALPLRGITILAVEDSRFASEALRLMCQRLGARLRRAETIHAARSHLRLYRPNVVIVDLGLPDGRGEALIGEIIAGGQPVVVLGTSGDPAGRALALAAGAAGFLDKPLESLAAFQALLIRHLPERIAAMAVGTEAPLHPDSLALRDDLARAAALIEAGTSSETQAYLSGFLSGVARHAHDAALAEAAESAGAAPQMPGRLETLRTMLQRRLDGPDAAFGRSTAAG
jgi:DNA-binding NarL/FixJ family response regulator